MKAMRVHQFGAEMQMDEIDNPTAASGEALIELEYASVNPLDIWVTRGTVAGGNQPLPFIPGVEGVGRIDSGLVLVYGGGVGIARDGLYAQRAAIPLNATFSLPTGIDPVQAAGVGVAGVTAWNVAHDVAKVSKDDIALVLGASGGVGSVLVQVLRLSGVRVIAQTSSPQKAAFLHEIGVDQVIESTPEAIPDLDPQPTVVFDPLGGAATSRAVQLVALFGRLVIFGTSLSPTTEIDLRALYRKEARLLTYSGIARAGQDFGPAANAVLTAVASGEIHVPIDSVLALSDANDAHKKLLAQQAQGKIILKIGD